MAPEQSSNKIGKSVGEKIRAARVALKYTQSQLASPDFSVSYISAIERGQIHPSLRALEIIATRLGLPSTHFLPQRSQPVEGEPEIIQPEREDDEGEYVLLKAHQLLAQGNAEETLAVLGKVSAKRMKLDQQLQHRYLTASARFQLVQYAQYQECEQLFQKVVEQAKETLYSYVYCHALDMLGAVYAASENYEQALLMHHHCLDLLLADAVRDAPFLSRVYTELGEDYAGKAADDEAREMFTHAIEVSHEFETSAQIEHIYTTLSFHYAEKKDLFVSTLYTYLASFANEERSRKQQRSTLYYALGKSMVMQDSKNDAGNGFHNEDSAYHKLMEMQEQEKQAIPQDALTIAAIDLCIGQWLYLRQRLAEALQCVREAIHSAQPSSDTLILADAMLLSGRIEYAQQKFEQGDEHFAEGLTILERLNLADELSENAMYYAQQLEERGKEREALIYFRRAFQSSQNRYVGA